MPAARMEAEQEDKAVDSYLEAAVEKPAAAVFRYTHQAAELKLAALSAAVRPVSAFPMPVLVENLRSPDLSGLHL